MSKVMTLDDVKKFAIGIESSVVACFWKNPDLFFDYSEIKLNMFKNNIWRVYFTIGKMMANKGLRELDPITVETFLVEQPKLKEKYEEYGGYSKIEIGIEFVNENNVEGMVNTLKKNASIYDYIESMTITEEMYKDLREANLDETYAYLNSKFNEVFINTSEGSTTGNLDDDLDELIEEADAGMSKGLPFDSPILSDEIGGLMAGQIILFGGLSGTGKTTTTQELHLQAVWENQEPTLIILNEQPKKKWQQQFLTWLINNKILAGSDKKFSSRRWRDGHFTDEEKEWLKEATAMLKEKMINNFIVIAEMDSYSQKKAERLIKKYASLGFKYFVIDTFKISADSGSSDLFWLSMQEDMRKFDDLVKPSNLNVNLWVTLQLQKGSVFKRYLTGDNIGMAKNIIDVASVGLLMRSVRNDEFAEGKNPIEVIKPIAGTSSGTPVVLDPTKHYVIIFIEKNRNGQSQSYQIVAEQNLGTLEYKEIGICNIPFDT